MGDLILFGVSLVIVVAVCLLLRKPLQRRWYAGTGLVQWNAAASTLPWRDRWTLYRVNSRGREAPARLAALAVLRGRSAIAVTERTIERTSGIPKLWPIMTWLGVFMVVLNAARLAADPHDSSAWLLLGLWVPLTVLYAGMGRLQRRQLRLLRRWVQLNSERAAQDAG